MRPALLLLSIASILSACQSTPVANINRSYVEPLADVDQAALGTAIAGYIAEVWPAARTTILLVPPASEQVTNPFTQSLTTGLLNSGFGVTEPNSAPGEGAHRLQYWVTTLDGEVLVRLKLDQRLAARVYAKDASGHLVAQSPVTMSRE
jgi:hypothetical protein